MQLCKLKQYVIGEEVTIQSEKYNVIGQGDDYVTLLKQEPLTTNEVNTYGGVGTANNHVNMYNSRKTSDTYYHQAYNIPRTAKDNNGYGGMAYYSSSTCGYVNGSWQFDGCTTSYNQSEVKYVVDAWAAAKFTDELKTVDGYSARLAQKEELKSIGWPSCSSTDVCPKETATPSWLYNDHCDYWTMSQWNSSWASVWHVDFQGALRGNDNVTGSYYEVVRPVINVYKSVLEDVN